MCTNRKQSYEHLLEPRSGLHFYDEAATLCDSVPRCLCSVLLVYTHYTLIFLARLSSCIFYSSNLTEIMDSSTSHRHHEKRKRSRSPYRSKHDDRAVKRSRSRSPNHHKHHHHGHHRNRSPKAQRLPFESQHLHKRDLNAYRALLADYLDLQKHLDIRNLSEDEVKGRWKSFLRKWNAGDLAEGWYDPEVKRKANGRAVESSHGGNGNVRSLVSTRGQAPEENSTQELAREDDSEDDDDYGPALPDTARRSGPAVPSLQDLQDRRELQEEDRSANLASMRQDRKMDRKVQKERLEELAPRADPGSRERQLEKKREVTASNRAFADAKEGGADEVGEGDLMGDDGGDAYKRQLKETERRKNEREIRKEEVLRARAAEREERMAKARAKEDKTMEMLRGIAQARFGGGGGGD